MGYKPVYKPPTGFTGNGLAQQLEAEGLLPPNCADVQINAPSNGVLQMIYVINIDEEMLPKIARALTALAKENADEQTTR